METDLAGFSLPKIANIGIGMTSPNPSYTEMMEQIGKAGKLPTMTEAVLPSIASILSPEGQAVSPYAAAIRRGTSENIAQVQTGMQKRGMTGSSIEAGEMGRAQQAGDIAMANLYGQTANQLSNMIFQAATGDLQNNRELLLTLAQAMGQEITSQRDMKMFQEALNASLEEASKYRSSQKKAGIGQAVGTGVGGAVGMYFGGPMGAMAGMQGGGAVGGGLSGLF